MNYDIDIDNMTQTIRGRIDWFDYIRTEELSKSEKTKVLEAALQFLNAISPIVEHHIDGTMKDSASKFTLATQEAAK